MKHQRQPITECLRECLAALAAPAYEHLHCARLPLVIIVAAKLISHQASHTGSPSARTRSHSPPRRAPAVSLLAVSSPRAMDPDPRGLRARWASTTPARTRHGFRTLATVWPACGASSQQSSITCRLRERSAGRAGQACGLAHRRDSHRPRSYKFRVDIPTL